jgi:hypothetical protein
MGRRLLAGLLVALATAGFVAGQESEINWTVYGQGVTTCAEWTSARKQGGQQDVALRAWVSGFMSAAQYYHTLFPDTLARLPQVGIEDQVKWIDARCASRPADVVAVATRALLNDLSARGSRGIRLQPD